MWIFPLWCIRNQAKLRQKYEGIYGNFMEVSINLWMLPKLSIWPMVHDQHQSTVKRNPLLLAHQMNELKEPQPQNLYIKWFRVTEVDLV